MSKQASNQSPGDFVTDPQQFSPTTSQVLKENNGFELIFFSINIVIISFQLHAKQ